MSEVYNRGLLERRLRDLTERGDDQSIRETADMIDRAHKSKIGQLTARVATLEGELGPVGSAGTPESRQSESGRLLNVMPPSAMGAVVPVGQSCPGPIAAPANTVWLRTVNGEAPLRSVVGVTSGRVARLAKTTGTESDRIMPLGVVVGRDGHWAAVQTYGPADVRLDTLEWTRDYYNGWHSEVWASESADGVGSARMPTTSRNDISLIGHQIGPVKNGVVRCFVRCTTLPAQHYNVFQYDDDNWIDVEMISGVRGQTVRMVFWVGGEVFAHLTEDAHLYLRGNLQILAFGPDVNHTAANSANGEIEYNEGGNSEIGFAVNDGGGNYVHIAEMLPSGIFRVGGFSALGYPKTRANSPTSDDFCAYDTTDTTTYLRMHIQRVWCGFKRIAVPPAATNAAFECEGWTGDAFAY
jgi:hypothetical protein